MVDDALGGDPQSEGFQVFSAVCLNGKVSPGAMTGPPTRRTSLIGAEDLRVFSGGGSISLNPYNRSRRVSASPKLSSFTPILSMIERNRLDIFRFSSPACR